MTILSILQSVLPVKKEIRTENTRRLMNKEGHTIIIEQNIQYNKEAESYNQAISDLTDRLSKAEFVVDEEKFAKVLFTKWQDTKKDILTSRWEDLDILWKNPWYELSKAITSQLPSLLSVVEKKEKV